MDRGVCGANVRRKPRTISELERSLRQVGYDTVAAYAQSISMDIVFQIRGVA